MDITFFSKCLKDLVIVNDVVTVPGLGCFIATNVPASFSDQGRTINPPYRKLSFRAVSKDDGSLFLDALKKSLPAGKNPENELLEFITEFKKELNQKRSVTLEGLGTMRATAEKDYFFVASDDMEIYPEGLGLEPIAIKTHIVKNQSVETTTMAVHEPIEEAFTEVEQATEVVEEKEVEEAISTKAEVEEGEIAPQPEPRIAPEIEPESEQETETAPEPETRIALEIEPEPELEPEQEQEPQPEHKAESEPEPKPAPARMKKHLPWWIWPLIVLAAFIIFLIVIYVFKNQLSPFSDRIIDGIDNMLNNLLYSDEELEIIKNLK